MEKVRLAIINHHHNSMWQMCRHRNKIHQKYEKDEKKIYQHLINFFYFETYSNQFFFLIATSDGFHFLSECSFIHIDTYSLNESKCYFQKE